MVMGLQRKVADLNTPLREQLAKVEIIGSVCQSG